MAKQTPEVPPTTIAEGSTTSEPTIDIQALVEREVAKRMKEVKASNTPNTFDSQAFTDSLTKALAQVMPQMASQMGMSIMSAQQAVAMGEHQKILTANKAKLALLEKCHICRQVVGDGKGRGCGGPYRRDPKTNEFVLEPVYVKDDKGNDTKEQLTDGQGKPVMRRIEDPTQFHTKMVVFPKDPIGAKWFFGIGINGTWYMSQGPNHEIWVPKMNDLPAIEATYTQNEVEQRVGRSHRREYGGTVSGKGGGVMGNPGTGVGFQ